MNQHNSNPQSDSRRPLNGHDQRCYYSVDDQLYFELKPADPKTMRQQQARELTLLQELHKLEEECQALLHEIAQQVCQLHSEEHTVQLNLREGGLDFQYNNALNVGDYVAVTLGLEEDP